MRALILASGLGTRLAPLTDDIPKCLVRLKDKPILAWQLEAIRRAGVREVILTTGPFEERVSDFIRRYEGELDIVLVKNELYDKTNYIYSIYRAKDYLNDSVLLLHGDLIFAYGLLEELLRSTPWGPKNRSRKSCGIPNC